MLTGRTRCTDCVTPRCRKWRSRFASEAWYAASTLLCEGQHASCGRTMKSAAFLRCMLFRMNNCGNFPSPASTQTLLTHFSDLYRVTHSLWCSSTEMELYDCTGFHETEENHFMLACVYAVDLVAICSSVTSASEMTYIVSSGALNSTHSPVRFSVTHVAEVASTHKWSTRPILNIAQPKFITW